MRARTSRLLLLLLVLALVVVGQLQAQEAKSPHVAQVRARALATKGTSKKAKAAKSSVIAAEEEEEEEEEEYGEGEEDIGIEGTTEDDDELDGEEEIDEDFDGDFEEEEEEDEDFDFDDEEEEAVDEPEDVEEEDIAIDDEDLIGDEDVEDEGADLDDDVDEEEEELGEEEEDDDVGDDGEEEGIAIDEEELAEDVEVEEEDADLDEDVDVEEEVVEDEGTDDLEPVTEEEEEEGDVAVDEDLMEVDEEEPLEDDDLLEEEEDLAVDEGLVETEEATTDALVDEQTLEDPDAVGEMLEGDQAVPVIGAGAVQGEQIAVDGSAPLPVAEGILPAADGALVATTDVGGGLPATVMPNAAVDGIVTPAADAPLVPPVTMAPPVSLVGDSLPLFESLVEATVAGNGWGNVTMGNVSTESIAPALTELVLYVCTTAQPAFVAKYESIGKKVPQLIDLAGLVSANSEIKTEDWDNVWNATLTALTALPPQGGAELAPLVWSAASAFRVVTSLEKEKGNLKDMNDEQRTSYLSNVAAYFRASAEIAWMDTTALLVDLIARTEAVGNYREEDDAFWFTDLITDQPPAITQSASIFIELALLPHVPAASFSKAPGVELGSSVADKYITAAAAFLAQGNVAAVSQLFEDGDLVDYKEIAARYCTADHTLRFCLLTVFADQANVLAAVTRDLYNADTVTTLPLAAASMRRQDYLSLLNTRLQKQQLSLEITKAFDELQESVHRAASDVTVRSQGALYEKTVQQQEAIKGKMTQSATEFEQLAADERSGGQAAFKLLMDKVSGSLEEVNKLSEPYLDRVKDIAQKALDAEQAKTCRGFFGFFTKVLNLFNPVAWVTNPGVFSDVLKAGNELRKSVDGVGQVKRLINIIKDSLIPMFHDLMDKMEKLGPQLEKIAKAVDPIVAITDPTPEKLQEMSSAFLDAFRGYENPVLATDVDIIEELFVNIQSELCSIAGKKATEQCLAVQTDVKLFATLNVVITTSDQALTQVISAARGAVTEQSAKIFKAGVEKSYNESVQALDALQSEWDKENDANEKQFQVYQRKLKYGQAVASLSMLATSARSSAAMLMACNFLTYLNGGVAVTECLPMYKTPGAIVDIKTLIAFQFATRPEEYESIAYIPTTPANSGDMAYLDMQRMMEPGVNTTFQLPEDPAWLARNGWVPPGFDLANTVAFISRFQLMLPPKQVVSTSESDVSRRMVNVVTRASVSKLGPAVNGKTYSIPERRFVFSYEESRSAGENCPQPLASPYQTCDPQLHSLCPIAMGDSDATSVDVPLPSLFSPLNIHTQFQSSSTESLLSFQGVRGSAPLAVGIKLLFYSVKDQEKPAHAAVAAAPVAGAVDPATGLAAGVVDPATGLVATGAAPAGVAGVPSTGVVDPTTGLVAGVAPATGVADAAAAAGFVDPATGLVAGAGSATAANAAVPATNVAVPLAQAAAPGILPTRRRFLQAGMQAGGATIARSGAKPAGRCCAVGSYLSEWEGLKCQSCPQRFISQLGGLYCVPVPTELGSSLLTETSSGKKTKKKKKKKKKAAAIEATSRLLKRSHLL